MVKIERLNNMNSKNKPDRYNSRWKRCKTRTESKNKPDK